MRESRDALGDVVAAMRAHPRVAVVGPAGVGRTTIVTDAANALDADWPVVRGLRALRGTSLSAVAVAVEASPDDPTPSIADRLRRRAVDGVVVEDAHLLDGASLELVAGLPRWVATCRDDTPDVLARLAPDAVVTLAPVDPAQARRAVREVLGPVADRTVDRVVATAGGRHLLLRDVTGRGGPRTTLRARLATVVADQPDDLQHDLALLGASAHLADRLGTPTLPVPATLMRGPAALAERGLARRDDAGLVAEPPALALRAHEYRPDAEGRHRRLAEVAPDPLVAAGHRVLAGDDPRPALRAARLIDPTAGLDVSNDLGVRAAILVLAVESHPNDAELVDAALTACLAGGDLRHALELAPRVPDGTARLEGAIACHRGSPDTAAARRRVAEERGATGWRLEADVDLALAEVAAEGPSPSLAARLLALLDDPMLDLSRARVSATLAHVLAWLGRDADARRLLRYLAALGAADPEVEAEVHWLAGRDHRAAAMAGTLAGTWAQLTGAGSTTTPGDHPERAALAWVARDPRRAATALQRLADDATTAAGAWRCRLGVVLALRAAGDPHASNVAADLAGDLRGRGAVALLRRLASVPADAGLGAHAADDPLTPREREVLVLAGEGMTSREIGAHLGITPATVETHVASAMRRLGASTRLEAIARLAPA